MKNNGLKILLHRTIAYLLLSASLLGLGPMSARAESEEAKSTVQAVTKSTTATLTKVDSGFAEDKWRLILNCPSTFHRMTYTDQETGLYVHYNLYLPEDYSRDQTYPLVIFLGDEDSVGTNPELPLVQGRGGIVWTAPEWQEKYPAIVAVPLYREVIVDHALYTRTDYVELTKNFVKALCSEYAVDKYRVYGTGQGVGCEALMVLAAENQELFTACMFVSGRWNASKLEGLERQRFVFFSAEEDRKVRTFAEKLMDMFSADGYAYAHAVWDGTWTPDQRSAAGLTLTTSTTGHYFVSWKRGTVVPDVDIIKKAASRPAENTMAIHLASFELPYTCVAMMEWLFQQSSKLDVNTTR